MPYIPQSAALVYEVAALGKQWAYFQQTSMAETLNQVPAFVTIQQSFDVLKELSGNPRSLDNVPLTVSIHGLGEEHLGYIFYLNTRNAATKECFKEVKRRVQQDGEYGEAVRKYAGYKITELSKRDASSTLSYIEYNQYIIASHSSLLIEDIVRTLASKPKTGLEGFEKAGSAHGSLYINAKQLPKFLRTFVAHDQEDTLSTALATLSLPHRLDLKLTPHHLLLSGFASDEAANSLDLTKALQNQTAGAMLLASYLPQGTAILRHLTFSDAEQLLGAYQQNKAPSQSTDLLKDTLYPLLRGEVGYCTLTTQHNQKENQLVFIRVRDPQTFISTLQALNLIIPSPSRALHQPLNTYKLTKGDLQHALPSQLFPTFEAHYITQIDDYIVLANSLSGLQTWYAQYQKGKTWANTAQQNSRLASMLDRAQLSLFVDLKSRWPRIIQSLRPTWKQLFKKHADAFQKFDYLSLQLLHEQDAGYYTSILLNHEDYMEPYSTQRAQTQYAPVGQQEVAPCAPITATLFQPDARIVNQPWLVNSHRGKGYYILLQDDRHQLYFLDPTGKLLWKKALKGPITTDLFEVDYYKNNKTQYLFATDKQLHLIDYYGHEITKYPQPLHQPSHLRVVDYNHNKHYRFLIATTQGAIYLKDKYYNALPPWNPYNFGKSFADAPVHLRVEGKDYLLALQTNGTLQALNRKGESYPGFPVKLKADIHNPLWVKTGQTAEDTSLVILTDTGQHVSLNLTGRVQRIEQLDYVDPTARFRLCPNHATGHDAYVIMRKDEDKVAVLDEAGNLLFNLQHQARHLRLQYYHFGGNYQFYVLTDIDKQLTFLYDYTGKPLHDTPWHNRNEVCLLFSETEKQLTIYTGATTLSKHTLRY